MACSEWLNFTKVEENFEIITSRMLYNGLFGMLLPSPWLKKILKLQPLECSLMACYEWLTWDAFTFTMVEENFEIMTSQML